MIVRLLITSAVALMLAGPAFADCMQEIESLSEAVTQAETGASSADTGLPATQHQESLLAGDQQSQTADAAGASDTGKEEMPASPHQQQALTQQTEQGGEQQPADLIAEARDMAEAGDEEGCLQKVTQAKSMLGID
jgi:hypothetical protein